MSFDTLEADHQQIIPETFQTSKSFGDSSVGSVGAIGGCRGICWCWRRAGAGADCSTWPPSTWGASGLEDRVAINRNPELGFFFNT